MKKDPEKALPVTAVAFVSSSVPPFPCHDHVTAGSTDHRIRAQKSCSPHSQLNVVEVACPSPVLSCSSIMSGAGVHTGVTLTLEQATGTCKSTGRELEQRRTASMQGRGNRARGKEENGEDGATIAIHASGTAAALLCTPRTVVPARSAIPAFQRPSRTCWRTCGRVDAAVVLSKRHVSDSLCRSVCCVVVVLSRHAVDSG